MLLRRVLSSDQVDVSASWFYAPLLLLGVACSDTLIDRYTLQKFGDQFLRRRLSVRLK